MRNPEWIKVLLGDILDSEESLCSASVVGILLLAYFQTARSGSLPADRESLRRLLRRDPEEFEAAWDTVSKVLKEDGKGGLVHPKGLAAREEALAFNESQAAKRRGKVKKPSPMQPRQNRGSNPDQPRVIHGSTHTEHTEQTGKSLASDVDAWSGLECIRDALRPHAAAIGKKDLDTDRSLANRFRSLCGLNLTAIRAASATIDKETRRRFLDAPERDRKRFPQSLAWWLTLLRDGVDDSGAASVERPGGGEPELISKVLHDNTPWLAGRGN